MKHRSTTLIVFLALWLPLQALAGALAHCEQIASLGTDGSATIQEADADCHGHATTARDHDHSDHETAGHDCYHCDGSCHGLQSLMSGNDDSLLHDNWQQQRASTLRMAALNTPETPDRPPRNNS